MLGDATGTVIAKPSYLDPHGEHDRAPSSQDPAGCLKYTNRRGGRAVGLRYEDRVILARRLVRPARKTRRSDRVRLSNLHELHP